MIAFVLLITAMLSSSVGLALATFRLRRINRAIAATWPDWKGFTGTALNLSLLGCSLALSGAAAVFTTLPETIEEPSVDIERIRLENERLTQSLTELQEINRFLEEQTKAKSVPEPELPPPSEPVIAETLPLPEPPTPEPAPVDYPQPSETTTTEQPVPPEVVQLSQTVYQALYSGSIKLLEPVADGRFFQTLSQQLTINPFSFSALQAGLKQRLRGGYQRLYLTELKTAQGNVYLWKIITKIPGPDILERINVSRNKLSGFHFENVTTHPPY